MDTLDEVIQLLAAGERDRARAMVVRILQTDLQNVTAWRLLASLLDDPAQKMDCYRRIIAIAPDNQEAGEKLRRNTPTAQPARMQSQPVSAESLFSQKKAPSNIPADLPQAAPTIASPAIISYTPTPSPPAPAKNEFLRRMLGALGVKAKWLGLQSESDRKDKNASALALEAITPEEIIKMAGGPLPLEERRQCPKCQATISIHAQRCEWCGTRLEEEGPRVENSPANNQ